MAEKRALTIEAEYCRDWTVRDALREIIQNALDTKTNVEIVRDGITFRVSDRGTGLQLSDFLLGRSSKHSDMDAIGQFGEGIKIACLVIARLGRQALIFSNNKKFSFAMEQDAAWGSPLLTITIDDVPTSFGTTVQVECTQEEMKAAKELFLSLNPVSVLAQVGDTTILNKPGAIYVNGLLVSTVVAKFGYDFRGQKDLVNRDRNAIGHTAIVESVRKVVGQISTKPLIKQILGAATSATARQDESIELNNTFDIENPRQWKLALTEMFGSRVCIGNGDLSDVHAKEDNWIVLTVPWGFRWALHAILPYANEAVNKGKSRERIPLKNLTVAQRQTLEAAKTIAECCAEEAGLKTYPIRVFRDLHKDKGGHIHTGAFRGGLVEVEISLLNQESTVPLVGTLMHEYVHGTFNSYDCTRDFENNLTKVIADLGTKLIALRMRQLSLGVGK